MRFVLEMKCNGAAFEGEDFGPEVGRILRQVAERVEGGREAGNMLDTNGNAVGSFGVEQD